jgi:hypothetical protein
MKWLSIIWLTNSMDKQKPPENPSGFELQLDQLQSC